MAQYPWLVVTAVILWVAICWCRAEEAPVCPAVESACRLLTVRLLTVVLSTSRLAPRRLPVAASAWAVALPQVVVAAVYLLCRVATYRSDLAKLPARMVLVATLMSPQEVDATAVATRACVAVLELELAEWAVRLPCAVVLVLVLAAVAAWLLAAVALAAVARYRFAVAHPLVERLALCACLLVHPKVAVEAVCALELVPEMAVVRVATFA